MRITYIIPFSGYGGSEQQFLNTLREAKKEGHFVQVVTGRIGQLWSSYKKWADELHLVQMDSKFDFDPAFANNEIDRFNPDLIHVQRPGGEGLMMGLAYFIGEIPIFLTTLCDRDEGGLFWADVHILPSNYAQSLQSIPHLSRHVIPHSVRYQHVDKVVPDLMFKDKLIHLTRDKDLIFGRIGTLDTTKQPGEAIKIFHQIQQARPKYNMVFLLAGRNPYGWIEKNSHYFDHPDVHYLGELNEHEKWYFLHQLQFCLYPTTKEAQGLAMIEPMLCGVPVITYDDCANRETVKENGLGMVAPTIDQVGRATCFAIDWFQLEIKEEIEKHAQRVRDFYSPEKQFKALEALYASVLESV